MGRKSWSAGRLAGNMVMKAYRKSLRNSTINYCNGWFFVTSQVSHNKSIFGAVVGERVVLNEFGRQVWEYWLKLPEKYPELEIYESILMPNHFHALLRVRFRSTNHAHQLGFLMSRFKGGTGYLYGKLRKAGEVEDIGEHLWQSDYWDNLVTDEHELKSMAQYIRDNPKNWSRDRYGACTSYSQGNLKLLNAPRIAFVASQGYLASELRPRKLKSAKADNYDILKRAISERLALVGATAGSISERLALVGATAGSISERLALVGATAGSISERLALVGATAGSISERSALADPTGRVLISTFTSAQEREALRRVLKKRRPFIMVAPAGIPREAEQAPEILDAIAAGQALILSPQPPGSKLNKKVATWCNEYVLRQAEEVWVGDLSPNGMLFSMLKGLRLID